MDHFIAILLLIIIVEALSSSRKKRSERHKRARQTAQEQQEASMQVRAPKEQSAPAETQAKIPYTRAEWDAYLRTMEVNAGEPVSKTVETQTVVPAQGSLPTSGFHDDPEGSISTQGESAQEHAEHRRRIAEEEARHRHQSEVREDLRAANLKRLRDAVVMSEILSKPVTLRPRIGYHR